MSNDSCFRHFQYNNMLLKKRLFPFCLLCFLGVLLIPTKTTNADLHTIQNNNHQYQCLPCGQDCDKKIYSNSGNCESCQMKLVLKSSILFKNITPEKICNYIKNHPKTVLLDVRTKEEYEGKAEPDFGTLRNAINIPIQELEMQMEKIISLKYKEIIVFCSHSHRSPQASYLLTQNGFTKIMNMSGGMSVMKDNSCKK